MVREMARPRSTFPIIVDESCAESMAVLLEIQIEQGEPPRMQGEIPAIMSGACKRIVFKGIYIYRLFLLPVLTQRLLRQLLTLFSARNLQVDQLQTEAMEHRELAAKPDQ
jgi:hypothetical protein